MITAGLIWGLFNIGFAVIFSFGPTMLVERGWSIAAAGSAISIVLWVAVFSVPFGGYLADRTGRPQTILVTASLVFAGLMILLPRTDAVILTVAALGLISGQPAGPIMSLPAKVLQPATRAIGMGLFFTMFYAAMMLGPVVAGALREMDRKCRRGVRLRRRGGLAVPGAAVGLQPDCCGATTRRRGCPHLMQPLITHR